MKFSFLLNLRGGGKERGEETGIQRSEPVQLLCYAVPRLWFVVWMLVTALEEFWLFILSQTAEKSDQVHI